VKRKREKGRGKKTEVFGLRDGHAIKPSQAQSNQKERKKGKAKRKKIEVFSLRDSHAAKPNQTQSNLVKPARGLSFPIHAQPPFDQPIHISLWLFVLHQKYAEKRPENGQKPH
jgi:hypothetical protein